MQEPARVEWLALYESNDVFLTSSRDGTGDNHTWEAMARGCVPVFSGSGGPAILIEGETGFRVPSHAGPETAAVLKRLGSEPSWLDEISRSAFRISTTRIMRQSDTIDDYLDLFDRIRTNPAYRRPRGPILFPPTRIDGADIFTLEPKYVARGVGPFPSRRDYLGYRAELKAASSFLSRSTT